MLSATVAAAFLAGPVFAQADSLDVNTMTCASLLQLDETAMTAAVNNASTMMQFETMSDTDKQALEDKMATETAGMSEAEKSAHRMTALQTEMQAKTDAMTEEEKTAQTQANADMMTKLKTACTGNDTMPIMDALKSSM
jgi:hypothetical protein